MQRARLKRILLIVTAGVAAVLVMLLLPPVQTGIVRAAAGGVDGVELEVERVWAGPWGADIRGLRLVLPGVEIEVPSAEADVAFWSSLGHLGLHIEEARAEGLVVQVGERPKASGPRAEPVPFDGLAPLARLPRRIVVRQASAVGSLEVTLSESLAVTGPWSLTAADIGPGSRSQGSLEASLEVVRDAEVVAGAEVGGSLSAVVDDNAAVTAATFDAVLRSVGTDAGALEARLDLELAPELETCRLTIDTSGGHRIAGATVAFTPGSRILEAEWATDLSPDLLAVFARGRTLPELSARVKGGATLALDEGRLEVASDGRIEGRGWADFDPRLREVDDLQLDFDVAGTVGDGRLEARRLLVTVTGEDGRELLHMTGLQPLDVDLEAWRFIPERWGETALRFEADRFPRRWTRGFDRAGVVEAGTLSLALDVVPVDDRHSRMVTHEPIRVAGLRLKGAADGAPAPPVDITVVPQLELDNGVLAARVERAELTAAGGFVLEFSGEASTSSSRWPAVSFAGDLSMAMPWLQQLVDALDRVRGAARFDLDLGSMVLAADGASLELTAMDGRSLMEVRFENEQPLLVALPSLTPDWESAAPQRVALRFDGLPIAWVSPYIPELDLAGGALFGELHAVGGGGSGLTLAPVAPFEVRDLQPVYRGIPVVRGSTVSVEPRLRLDNAGARFALENIRLRTPDRDRLDGEVVLESAGDGSRRVSVSMFFEGEFPTVADRIGRLGALSWRQESVLDLSSRTLEVTGLEVGLTDAAGTRFLELASSRPFLLAADPFVVRVDGGSPEILRATVTPLELQQLFPKVLGFQLEGVLPQGQFAGRVEDGGILLAADEPLVFKDVSVRWQEAALLDRVTVGLQYQVLYSAEGLQARSIDFTTLGPRGTPIADASLRAVMPLSERSTLESLHFEVLANLEPLTRQPIFRGLPAFLDGTIGGSVDVSLAERSSLAGSLALRGARIEDTGVLPDVDASLDVVRVTGERLEVTAPLRLSSDNGISDLRFAGDVVRSGETVEFEAALTGDRLVVPDVMRFVNLMSSPASCGEPSQTREAVGSDFQERWSKTAIDQLREQRDEAPFWGRGVSGRATLDLGALELARYAVREIHGELHV
ncbi:MAG TPA: hypothetical protein VLT32_07415, partial [Candidatus Sulfomarinibacteraceae bacterium]|nr:hypothetical protein [Candidatus Sulfomarinibacteraceae bacterium]